MIEEVACTLEGHGQAILDIFNEAIERSTALYDLSPRGWPQMVSWFDAKAQGGFPVIGLSNEEGTLMGFATYGRSAPSRPTSTPSSTRSTFTETTAAKAWGAPCFKSSSSRHGPKVFT